MHDARWGCTMQTPSTPEYHSQWDAAQGMQCCRCAPPARCSALSPADALPKLSSVLTADADQGVGRCCAAPARCSGLKPCRHYDTIKSEPCIVLTVDADQGIGCCCAAQRAVQGVILAAGTPERLHQSCAATKHEAWVRGTTGWVYSQQRCISCESGCSQQSRCRGD